MAHAPVPPPTGLALPDAPRPGPGPGAPIRWQAARVLAVHDETRRVKTFRLALRHRTRHMAGQYFVLRLTAPGSARAVGRIRTGDVAPLVRGGETVFVCGSAAFAGAATELLLAAGVPTASIRVERHAPSG